MKDAKWYDCPVCKATPGGKCVVGTWQSQTYHDERIALALADPSDSVRMGSDVWDDVGDDDDDKPEVVIQYDDQLTDVMDKINEALVPFGLHFSDDGEDHLGCCHYRITRVR